MTNKEYLEQVCEMDMNIAYLLEKRDTMKASLLAGGVASYDRRIGSDSVPDDRSFEKRMEKYILLEEEINRQIDEMIELKSQVEGVINRLKDFRARVILLRRYINGVSYAQIADEYGYTEGYVAKLARVAIHQLKIPTE